MSSSSTSTSTSTSTPTSPASLWRRSANFPSSLVPHHYQSLQTDDFDEVTDTMGARGAINNVTSAVPSSMETGNTGSSKDDIENIQRVPPDGPTGHHNDAVAELLRKTQETSDGARIVVTPEDDKRVLCRIDLVILPIMLSVYFLQGIDKATLAYASVFGLLEDANLTGDEYSWLGSIVYLAQLVMQPVFAYLLVKLPIGKLTSTTVLLWGATLACMAAAHDFGGLLTARFFLGTFEAGVAPSFVAVTQMWWRRREQTVRVSYWYAMNGVTNMFGSLITYGLGHIPSAQLKAYQIIFLFFGLLTVAFSTVMFAFMPDSPVDAKFLKDHDKLIAIERLRMNQMGVMSREWCSNHAKESMLDPKTWFWFALIFCISIPSGGISTFGPLIVKSFGFDQFETILFNIPFGFVQFLATIGGAFLAMKLKKKGPVIALLCLPPIAGCVILLVTGRGKEHQAVLLVGYYLISVYPGITPLIYAWSSQNTAGDTKKKCTNGLLFVGQSVGNVVGPQLYTPAEAPFYHRGLISNLALYIAIAGFTAITTLYLMALNKSHSKKRVAMGKSAVILDESLDSVEEIENRRAALALAADSAAKGGSSTEPEAVNAVASRVGDKAFKNLTDLQNEEFVFVY